MCHILMSSSAKKLFICAIMVFGFGFGPAYAAPTIIHVVAAENFWGSLLLQIGGSRVTVISVVADPNADPHEYASNTNTAKFFTTADYVVLNGAGYDSWADKLLSAGTRIQRKVLKVADILGKKNGDNPHFWYNPDYVNLVIAHMEEDLISIDPTYKEYYLKQSAKLKNKLSGYQSRISSIKNKFRGIPIGSTESISFYLANSLGLNLSSPEEFMDAVAEGNNPPVQSIVKFEKLIKDKRIKVLIFNQQTLMPITDTIIKLAVSIGIPVIGITEIIEPPDLSFQDWMNAELIRLENALGQVK